MKNKNIAWIVVTVILIVAVVIAVCTVGWLTDGFKTWGVTDNKTDENPMGDDLIIGNITAHGISITPSALEVSGVVTINATVKDSADTSPDNLQDVSWSLAWNAGGTGPVSDYVTMTTNGTSATLKLVNAFGTQIILTCTSNLNTSVKATATVDYYKRLSGATVNMNSTDKTVGLSGSAVDLNTPDYSTFANSGTWAANSLYFYKFALFGTGTVGGEVTYAYVNVNPSTDFSAKLNSLYSGASNILDSFTFGGGDSDLTSPMSFYIFFQKLGMNMTSNISLRNAFFQALDATTNQFEVKVNLTHYNGISETVTYAVNVNVTTPAIGSVTLNDGAVVF